MVQLLRIEFAGALCWKGGRNSLNTFSARTLELDNSAHKAGDLLDKAREVAEGFTMSDTMQILPSDMITFGCYLGFVVNIQIPISMGGHNATYTNKKS